MARSEDFFGDAMKANNFNFIRMLAAAAVIVSHSFPLRGQSWDPLQYIMNGVPLGQMAVDTFFVISGYLICQSWVVDPNFVRFMARRALRLMPALAVVLLLSVFVIGPVFTTLPLAQYFRSPMTWDYLRGLGLVWLAPSLPGVFPAGAYPFAFNGPLWTIRIEAACYVLLFATGMLGVLRSRYATLLTFLVLTYFRFELANHPQSYGCSLLPKKARASISDYGLRSPRKQARARTPLRSSARLSRSPRRCSSTTVWV